MARAGHGNPIACTVLTSYLTGMTTFALNVCAG